MGRERAEARCDYRKAELRGEKRGRKKTLKGREEKQRDPGLGEAEGSDM